MNVKLRGWPESAVGFENKSSGRAPPDAVAGASAALSSGGVAGVTPRGGEAVTQLRRLTQGASVRL